MFCKGVGRAQTQKTLTNLYQNHSQTHNVLLVLSGKGKLVYRLVMCYAYSSQHYSMLSQYAVSDASHLPYPRNECEFEILIYTTEYQAYHLLSICGT